MVYASILIKLDFGCKVTFTLQRNKNIVLFSLCVLSVGQC